MNDVLHFFSDNPDVFLFTYFVLGVFVGLAIAGISITLDEIIWYLKHKRRSDS